MNWIMLVLVFSGHDIVTMTSTEFQTKQACLDARIQLEAIDKGNTKSVCVAEGSAD